MTPDFEKGASILIKALEDRNGNEHLYGMSTIIKAFQTVYRLGAERMREEISSRFRNLGYTKLDQWTGIDIADKVSQINLDSLDDESPKSV